MLPLILASFLGCATCPEGLERSGGACVPAGTGSDGVDGPLDADSFVDAYDRQACSELERCAEEALCSGDTDDDCTVDVDCQDSDWSWADGCAFDAEAAEDCVDGAWTCDAGDYTYEVTAPSDCDDVFDCSATAGATTATGTPTP